MAALKTVQLDASGAAASDLRKLEIGTVAYLTGRIFTAREGVYKRAIEDGAGMPAGSAKRSGLVRISIARRRPRSQSRRQLHRSARCTAHRLVPLRQMARRLVQAVRLQHHHRQGRHDVGDLPQARSCRTRRSISPRSATAPARCSAAASSGVAGVYWLEELGLAQAVWVLDVEKFGPFLVESDLAGNSLFERENAKIAPGIEKLYAGTSPATLRRYGETDDKTDEVI